MTATTEIFAEGRPAATVVIARDTASGPPEILMMERASTMAFAAGALVFPGGAVDRDDHVLAEAIGGPLPIDEAAARIAAIRETLEECGLGVGMSGHRGGADLAEMRAALDTGMLFSGLVIARGITLAFDSLLPFARWHPASFEQPRRVYDTRFYLARAPEGQPEPSADATENTHLFWSSASATLAQCDAGEGRVIYPTRRNLERLAQFARYEEIVAHAATTPVETVRPWLEQRDDGRHLCIPGHLGYPVTSELLGTAQRG